MIIFLLILLILGGLLSIEGLLWGKMMLARPIIFVPFIIVILSWIHYIPNNMQIILLFFSLSILIELRFLFTIPVGSSFVPDMTLGTLSSFFLIPIIQNFLKASNFYSILLFMYIMIFSLSYVSGYFDVLVRRFNTVLVEYGKKLLSDGDFRGFEKLSKYGYILFFLKGFFLTLFNGILIYVLFKILIPILDYPAINKFSLIFLITVLSRFVVSLFNHWRIFKNGLLNFFIFIVIIITIVQFKRLGIGMMLLIFIAYLFIEVKKFKNG